MSIKEITDRNGRIFGWDEAEGYGWFSDMSKNMLKNGFAEQMAKLRDFIMRDDDVLICAFPKAGTNWVWEIASMVQKEKAEYDRHFKMISMLEMRSDVLHLLPSPRVLNTHAYSSCFPNDVVNKKVKIIHIMRHPKDMAVSFYYHFKQLNFSFETTPYETFSEFLPYVTGEYGVHMLVSMFRFLNEFQVFSKEHPHMVLNLYFEDIKENPTEVVQRIAEFLGKRLTQDIVQQIAEKCSFRNMKESERFKEFPPNVFAYMGESAMSKLKRQGPVVFFRKGEVGDWKNHFTVAESEQFDKLIEENLKDNMFIKRYCNM